MGTYRIFTARPCISCKNTSYEKKRTGKDKSVERLQCMKCHKLYLYNPVMGTLNTVEELE